MPIAIYEPYSPENSAILSPTIFNNFNPAGLFWTHYYMMLDIVLMEFWQLKWIKFTYKRINIWFQSQKQENLQNLDEL